MQRLASFSQMEYQHLLVDTTSDIATLALDRPDRLNALSAEMLTELIRAAEEIASSRARAVVVRGEGRAFCAGVDMDTFMTLVNEPDTASRHASFKLGGQMADAIEAIPQVTVAALHGFVVGGGLILAAACDLRVAADDTVFSIPEVDMGIPLGWGGIERLIREIGPALTKELVMTCRRSSADELRSAGFLNTVVTAVDVDGSAHDLAAVIAAKPRIPIEITKKHVREVLLGDRSRDDNLSAVERFDDPESVAAREPYVARFIGST